MKCVGISRSCTGPVIIRSLRGDVAVGDIKGWLMKSNWRMVDIKLLFMVKCMCERCLISKKR